MSDKQIIIDTLRENLGEETIQKLELMEQNEVLCKENYELRESCENFIEVETNLHRKIKEFQKSHEELVEVLGDLLKDCSNVKTLITFLNCKSYSRALKVLDKYKLNQGD